jgi:hypothetical protein
MQFETKLLRYQYQEVAMSILNEHQLLCNDVHAAFSKVVAVVQSASDSGSCLDELERRLMPVLMEVGLACLQSFIVDAGDGDVGEQLTVGNQVAQRSADKHSRVYRSIFGQVSIARYVYSQRAKTKALAKPLDQKLGLPADEVSYVLEDWLGSLSVGMPYETATEWLQSTLGICVSSTTGHRRIANLGCWAEEFNQERAPVRLAHEEEILVAQADGKGVPIRTSFEKRANEELGVPLPRRPALKKDYAKSKHRVKAGRETGGVQRATCGAFYSIARHQRTATELLESLGQRSPRPVNKRLWAEMNLLSDQEVSRGSVRVFESLANELAERDPHGAKQLVVLMDGDPHLWALQQEYLPNAIAILDLFHATEKLWSVANCLYQENSEQAGLYVAKLLKMLLENKVDCVRGLLMRAVNHGKLTKHKQKQFKQVHRYFTNNRQRMRYADYLEAGFPIGSGVIEGACKNVIGDRMCCTGMRWELEGAQPMLDMRVVKLNGQWDQFIQFRIKNEQMNLYNIAA